MVFNKNNTPCKYFFFSMDNRLIIAEYGGGTDLRNLENPINLSRQKRAAT